MVKRPLAAPTLFFFLSVIGGRGVNAPIIRGDLSRTASHPRSRRAVPRSPADTRKRKIRLATRRYVSLGAVSAASFKWLPQFPHEREDRVPLRPVLPSNNVIFACDYLMMTFQLQRARARACANARAKRCNNVMQECASPIAHVLVTLATLPVYWLSPA